MAEKQSALLFGIAVYCFNLYGGAKKVLIDDDKLNYENMNLPFWVFFEKTMWPNGHTHAVVWYSGLVELSPMTYTFKTG